jgi:hypothetical protein
MSLPSTGSGKHRVVSALPNRAVAMSRGARAVMGSGDGNLREDIDIDIVLEPDEANGQPGSTDDERAVRAQAPSHAVQLAYVTV